MRGGVILFRGPGAEARRYVDATYARAAGCCRAEEDRAPAYVELDQTGAITAERTLTTVGYEAWVDWINPITGKQMSHPRRPSVGRAGSVRFADVTVNVRQDWSALAVTDRAFAAALDAAQFDAAEQIRWWVAQHALTRVGPQRAQGQLPVERLQVVVITHDRNRRGSPYRHLHVQIGGRVWAVEKWRALDTAALLFKQQNRIRRLGETSSTRTGCNPQPELPHASAGLGLTRRNSLRCRDGFEAGDERQRRLWRQRTVAARNRVRTHSAPLTRYCKKGRAIRRGVPSDSQFSGSWHVGDERPHIPVPARRHARVRGERLDRA